LYTFLAFLQLHRLSTNQCQYQHGLSVFDPDFNIMQQSHGLFTTAKLLVRVSIFFYSSFFSFILYHFVFYFDAMC